MHVTTEWHDRVMAMAREHRVSGAELVRRLVERGLTEDWLLDPPAKVAKGESIGDRLKSGRPQLVRGEDPRGVRTQSGRRARGGASRTPGDSQVAPKPVRGT